MKRKWIWAALCMAAIAGAALWYARHLRVAPESAGAVLSPNGQFAVRVVQESGRTSVWLETYNPNARKVVADLGVDQSAVNVLWSPDSALFAFQTFDPSGHSPMTTSRVWVVSAASIEARELKLPPPNERFSMYLEGWVGNDMVKLRSTLLDRPEDVFFVYSYPTNAIHPAG